MGFPDGSRARPVDPDLDLDRVSGLYLACDLVDVGEPDHQRDWIVESWRSPALIGAWIVSDADGDVAAYVELESSDAARHIDASAPVRPDLRDGPMRGAVIAFVEERARAAAAGAASLVYLSGAQTDPSLASGALAAGFSKVRTFWHMERAIDPSYDPGDPPAGVTIRPSTRADDHAIYLVLDSAFRGHFGIGPVAEDVWREEFFGMPMYDPDLTLIAELGGEPVGVAASFMPDGLGWIGDLGVLEGFRGKGIGTALLRASFATLASRGATQLRLNVDADNETGAPHLYAAVGMTVRRAFDVYEKALGGG